MSSGALPPRMHQRKPSITPTTGLREQRSFHFSWMKELEKPTGEMYRLNLKIKVMM
jgi:hypothetical protein